MNLLILIKKLFLVVELRAIGTLLHFNRVVFQVVGEVFQFRMDRTSNRRSLRSPKDISFLVDTAREIIRCFNHSFGLFSLSFSYFYDFKIEIPSLRLCIYDLRVIRSEFHYF